MSKTIESNMNEMINSAGDGSGLQLPPAFVMVNPRQHRNIRKIKNLGWFFKREKDLFPIKRKK
ncbi:MAG: hypothetical protein CM15mV89_1020 [Caudoviricetes sp.]|nr:MAG: hypothetical protein CM15mV89_1020 [Caudoviricetes sp.]